MSTQLIRKPDYATETFIVTAVITFFIVIGVFFFYADTYEQNANAPKSEVQGRHQLLIYMEEGYVLTDEI